MAETAAAVRPETVFHLGGRVSGAVDPALVAPTFRSLLASSVALLAAAEAGRIGRLVLIGSTDEPHGDEVPASPYGAAKGAVTSYSRMFADAFATPVVIVRPAETFGPGQAAGKLLPYAAACALRGEAPRLSSGRRRGDWVFVDDVVDGLLRALGSDVEPSWGALPDRPAEPEHVADVEHTARVIGWRAHTPLEEGLRRVGDAARRAPSAPR